MTDNEIKTRTVHVDAKLRRDNEDRVFDLSRKIGNWKRHLRWKHVAESRYKVIVPQIHLFATRKQSQQILQTNARGRSPNWVIRQLLSLESTICSSDDLRKFELMWCKILRSDLNSNLSIRLGEKKSGPTMQTVYLLHNENSNVGRDVYVGSTSNTVEKRLSCHRSNCLRPGNKDNRLYKRMREVGPENWIMRQLLSMNCTKNQIRVFERMLCEILRSDLNSCVPFQTDAERMEYCEAYRKNNREVIRQSKAAHSEKNREEIRRKKAERYRRNRDSKKFFCEVCGITCGSTRDLKKHNETLKHQFMFLNSLD